MYKPEIEDLQFEIHHIKKENLDIKSENHLLKVKIRKFQDELNRRDKQLDELLDPKKNISVSKVFSRHGAVLIMKLKQENFGLHKKIAEKDLHIKKLQSDLETTKLYLNERLSKTGTVLSKLFEAQETVERVEDLNTGSTFRATTARVCSERRSKSVSLKKSRSPSNSPARESVSATNLQKSYMILLNNNLQKIKQCGNMHGDKTNLSLNSINSNKIDVPHEEIQQLQSYLLNVLHEVESLKNTISELQKEQTKTSLVLHDKDSNINKLVTEIATKKVKQALNGINKRKGAGSDTTELISTDIGSSKCSTCEYTGDSDYNETTEGSSVAKVVKTRNQYTHTTWPTRSVSIQTAREFCSRVFSAVESRHTIALKRHRINTDDNGLDIEFID